MSRLLTGILVFPEVEVLDFCGPFEVFAASDDMGVEVVVADGVGWVPTAPRAGCGQGLLLVGLLATAWTAETEGSGKRVWARLRADDVPLY